MTRMLSILYVDDEPDLLEIGKLFLEESGVYTIDTSISAADALIRLEQKKFDAIISDYQMPGMDGIKFLQVLRNRGDKIPFIIFTGRGREEVIIEALNSGVDFYLQKGGDPKAQFAELKNIIGKAVRQKSADDALKESEAKYRNILENIQDVYYRSDVDGNLILASPSMATVLGYDSLSELYGKNISRTLYYNPEQRKQFLSDINCSGSVTNYEVTLKKRDGTPVFVLTSSHKYYDQFGNFLGVEGIFLDITERKKAEDELRAAYEQVTAFDEEMQAQFNELKYGQDALRTSEKKLQGIVHGSPIPQFVIDKNHQVISWNSALERYSGVKADDVLGTSQQWKAFYPSERPCMADLLVDDTIDKIPEWYFGKYNKSKYVEGAYEATDFFPKMGTNGIWLYFTASTLRDSQGNIIGAVETLEDVTDIKVKETALRASEEQFRNVVETQTEFICRFKPDGTHVFLNEAYCRYFGKKCSELIGKKFRPEIPPEDRAIISAHFASLSHDHPVSTIDHRIIMSDGTIRWQRWVDRAIFDERGDITEYQTVGRDITDIKKAEEELRRMSRFQESIIANANVWLMALDAEGEVILWNKAAEDISGYSADEVLSNNRIWKSLYPDKEYRKKITQTLLQIITERKYLQNFETTIRTKSGELKTILWNTRSLEEIDDHPLTFVAIGVDITASILAEQALMDSENKLSAIVRGSPIPQFVIDRDHKVIQWNAALESYSSISAKEVLGTNQQWRAFYPSERPCMADLLVDGSIEKIPQWYSGKFTKSPLIENAYDATDFFPHMGKSGTWLYFTAAPIRDALGAIIGAVETLEDISESKKAEEELQRMGRFQEGIIANANVWLMALDHHGTILLWNNAAEEISGYSADEVVGNNRIWALIYPDKEYRRKITQKLLQIIKENKFLQNFETTIRTKSGNLKTILWNTRSLDETEEQSANFVAIGIDITKSVLAEQATRDSENKLNAIVKSSPIPQFVIDSNHKVIHWNTALERYSGIKAEDVIGTNQQWKAFYPSERPCMADLLVEGKREKIPQWYEGKYAKSTLNEDAYEATDFFPHMGPAGTWLYFTAAPIRNFSGKIIGAVETLEDISERKRTEDALKQINKKLNLMSSVTRHDILNQLTALAGYLDLLKQRLSERTDLDYIIHGECAVRNIERQILFTKVYQEIGVQSPEWQKISTIIRQAVNQLDHGSVTVEISVVDYEVFADRLLVKVFYNLIDNSLRYGEKNTIIRFYNRNPADDLVVICEDDGVGILNEEKERIFERGVGRHSGFGLFLAQEILSITGLTIRETGKPGEGARFEIHIPKGKFRQSLPSRDNLDK